MSMCAHTVWIQNATQLKFEVTRIKRKRSSNAKVRFDNLSKKAAVLLLAKRYFNVDFK